MYGAGLLAAPFLVVPFLPLSGLTWILWHVKFRAGVWIATAVFFLVAFAVRIPSFLFGSGAEPGYDFSADDLVWVDRRYFVSGLVWYAAAAFQIYLCVTTAKSKLSRSETPPKSDAG